MNEPNPPGPEKASSGLPQPGGNPPHALESSHIKINPLTRSELVAVLDSEIEQLEAENKRPGWSNWALQGGIATLLWLAMADFSPQSNRQTIAIVFLFGSLFGDFLLSVCGYFNGLNNPGRKQLRFRFPSDDPNTAPALLVLQLVRSSGLLLIYLWLDSAFQVPTLTWYCGIAIAFCIVGLLLRRIKSLSPHKGLSSKSVHSLTWLFIAWSGFLSYQLFEKLPFSDVNFRGADFRVGFLLVGVVYLFGLLTAGEKGTPIVNMLKGIRRDLAFGRMSVDEATKDADIALSGFTTTAAIEHNLTELTVELRNVTHRYEKLIADCRTAELALQRLEAEGNQEDSKWREDARKVAILIDSCETKRVEHQQLFNAAFFKTTSSLRSIGNLHATDLTPKPELASKWQDMRTKMEKMFELSKSSARLLEDIKARYTAISPVAGRSGK